MDANAKQAVVLGGANAGRVADLVVRDVNAMDMSMYKTLTVSLRRITLKTQYVMCAESEQQELCPACL